MEDTEVVRNVVELRMIHTQILTPYRYLGMVAVQKTVTMRTPLEVIVMLIIPD